MYVLEIRREGEYNKYDKTFNHKCLYIYISYLKLERIRQKKSMYILDRYQDSFRKAYIIKFHDRDKTVCGQRVFFFQLTMEKI